MKHKIGFLCIKYNGFPIMGLLIFIWEVYRCTIIMPSALINYICTKFFNCGKKKEKPIL